MIYELIAEAAENLKLKSEVNLSDTEPHSKAD